VPHPNSTSPPPAATQIARNCFTSARMPSMLASLSACYQPQSLPTRPRPLARLDEVGLRRRTCGNAAAAHACRNSGHAAAAEYALGLDPSLGLCIALACTLPLYLAYYSTNLDACVRRNLARLTLFCPLLYLVSPPTRYCCRSPTLRRPLRNQSAVPPSAM
jgi:hypothetical protein